MTNLEYIIKNEENIDLQKHGFCGICYLTKEGIECTQKGMTCGHCEFANKKKMF